VYTEYTILHSINTDDGVYDIQITTRSFPYRPGYQFDTFLDVGSM